MMPSVEIVETKAMGLGTTTPVSTRLNLSKFSGSILKQLPRYTKIVIPACAGIQLSGGNFI